MRLPLSFTHTGVHRLGVIASVHLLVCHWYVSILMCLLLASVSMFLLVTVNESTSGPFNDAGCHGNSLLLYSDGRGKEGSG